MDHGSLTGDRGFESVFLQRRVRRNFASRVTRRNVTLGNPTLTSELKERLAAGITADGRARHR
jgi:hypothetical protein